MKPFSSLPPAERALVINEAAGRLGLTPLIVEKDFWVCWTLARIFEAEAVAPHVVFKGGTSLSKVFDAIQRFSEDIDLVVSPRALGFEAAELDEAPSASQRRKRVQALEAECERCVSERFRPALEAAIVAKIGVPRQADTWLRYEIDALASTPNLLFTYPSAVGQAGGYIAKQVKLEFGALTDQQPTGTHGITALLAETPGVDLASAYDDLQASVVALEITRTFWEKATILHAEHHRPPELPIRDRFARHYADFEALWRHPSRADALARLDLNQFVPLLGRPLEIAELSVDLAGLYAIAVIGGVDIGHLREGMCGFFVELIRLLTKGTRQIGKPFRVLRLSGIKDDQLPICIERLILMR